MDSVYVMVYQQSNPQVYYSLSLGNFSDMSGLSVELFKTEKNKMILFNRQNMTTVVFDIDEVVIKSLANNYTDAGGMLEFSNFENVTSS